MRLDAEKRKLYFTGSCLSVLDLCKAMCCRKWEVNLSFDEIKSNSYRIATLCYANGEICKDEKNDCLNKKYVLKRKADSSCFYLNERNRCSIYPKRPMICREFSCKGGWNIVGVDLDAVNKVDAKKDALSKVNKDLAQSRSSFIAARKRDFIRLLNEDMLFMLNPLEKIETLFYLRRQKKIIVFSKSVGKCGLTQRQYRFPYSAFSDESLLYLIGLFNGQNALRDVYREIKSKYRLNLSKNTFSKIILFLHNAGLIIIVIPRRLSLAESI